MELNEIEEILNSDENSWQSLRDAYESLAEVIKANPENPEVVNNVVIALKHGLASDENNFHSLKAAYECLAEIIKANPQNPEVVNNVVIALKQGLASDKNDADSLWLAYECLVEVIKANPGNTQVVNRVLDLFKQALVSKNDKGSLSAAYYCLAEVIKANPENQQAGDLFKQALDSDKNDADSLEYAYYNLVGVIKANPKNPEVVNRALDLFKQALDSGKNDADSLKAAYECLAEIIEANKENPEVVNNVVVAIKQRLDSDKNDADSLKAAYECLAEVIKANPENQQVVNNVVVAIKQRLDSDKNDADSLKAAYDCLANIIKANPENQEVVNNVIAALKQGLASDKNDEYSLKAAYKCLAKIIMANPQNPEVVNRALDLFKQGLASDKNDGDSLLIAYNRLAEIAEANKENPEVVNRALDLFKQALDSDKNDEGSLMDAYKCLVEIIKANPENPQAWDLFKQVFASDKNAWYSLRDDYRSLAEVIKANPQNSEAWDLFKQVLVSDKNDSYSLKAAYECLAEIIKANPQNPEVVNNVVAALKQGLASDANNGSSLWIAYDCMDDIVKVNPACKEKVSDILIEELAKERFNQNYNDNDEDYGNNYDDEDYDEDDKIHFNVYENAKIVALALCMKYKDKRVLPLLENTDYRVVTVARKMSHTLMEERIWLLGNVAVDDLAKMDISTTKKSFNILLSQLCKESNVEYKDLRSNDRSEAVNKLFKDNADWLLPAAYNSAEIMGGNLKTYINRLEPYTNVHDAVYWLPKPMDKESNASFCQFCNKYITYNNEGQNLMRPQSELGIISANWKYLSEKERKLSYKDLLATCRGRKYPNQKYAEFATEAARWGIAKKTYKKWENFYAAGLDTPVPFDTSKRYSFTETDITEKDGKKIEKKNVYVGRFLDRKDPRVGFFGDYTYCCQNIGKDNAGESCAKSTMKDPYSQLFVIENKKGEIVAGSWVWENTEGKYRDVCFDNIEAHTDYAQKHFINEIYEQAAEDLCKNQNCHTVSIGLGYNDDWNNKYENLNESIKLPKQYHNQYTDSNSQVLLRENTNAKPLDHSKESERFIRNVCGDDRAEMQNVSSKCFYGDDKELQIPQRLSGKVLVDKDKGVVGYMLYDEKEKHVYDMAVLPQYRTDKNKSSFKLSLEVMKDLREKGGEWEAELREDTSLKLLQSLEKRGAVKLNVGGVDHTMQDPKDKNKIYKFYSSSFVFTPVEERVDVKQAESVKQAEAVKQPTAKNYGMQQAIKNNQQINC
jgi:hypothetical protein